MTTQPNINGVTVKDLTRIMNRIEKIINWYNKKYNYDIQKASFADQKEYNTLLEKWDLMKSKRNQLKAA